GSVAAASPTARRRWRQRRRGWVSCASCSLRLGEWIDRLVVRRRGVREEVVGAGAAARAGAGARAGAAASPGLGERHRLIAVVIGGLRYLLVAIAVLLDDQQALARHRVHGVLERRGADAYALRHAVDVGARGRRADLERHLRGRGGGVRRGGRGDRGV